MIRARAIKLYDATADRPELAPWRLLVIEWYNGKATKAATVAEAIAVLTAAL